ncbi:8716_t:CDS:2, partial [Cetraspora pellucida]
FADAPIHFDNTQHGNVVDHVPHPPELEQAPSVMISSSTQTSDDLKQIIQLLQEQIKQQAQVIAMLQEQTQTYKAQAQTIVHLQNKVDQFE